MTVLSHRLVKVAVPLGQYTLNKVESFQLCARCDGDFKQYIALVGEQNYRRGMHETCTFVRDGEFKQQVTLVGEQTTDVECTRRARSFATGNSNNRSLWSANKTTEVIQRRDNYRVVTQPNGSRLSSYTLSMAQIFFLEHNQTTKRRKSNKKKKIFKEL